MSRKFVVFLCVLLLVPLAGWADSDAHERSITDVESEIRVAIGLNATESIDPATVPDNLLIELGDAVMASHVGNEAQHLWMDQMMGGEGSASLDAAHRWMAYRYLSGGYGTTGMGGFGMMGPGMMGGGMGRGWGLMGDPGTMYDSIPYSSPEDILKRRYAEGEISREEYRKMLDDLK